MILRNKSTTEQTVSDGPHMKTVPPAGLVSVTSETGFQLLATSPNIWISEQALIPPPPR
jgi:hypothetical protein